jgi:peptidoglycan glycosyltransferase
MFYRPTAVSSAVRRRNATRRRRRRLARLLVALALVAFVAGVIEGANPTPPPYPRTLAERFLTAWAHGNYNQMYASIDLAAQRELSASAFAAAYREADATATLTRRQVLGAPRSVTGRGLLLSAPVRMRTLMFGTLHADFTLPIVGRGADVRIGWSRTLLFPGLRTGEQLTRQTIVPPRAPLLARDGTVLTEADIPSGLQSAFESHLRGTLGGRLYAGQRLLASATPHAASALRTSIDPAVQHAAVEALGGQYGGVVAFDPRSGQILAVAGIGLEAVQPPGSTFKMVTVSAALQAQLVTPRTVFPYGTYATLDGVKLSNAGGEDCGGSLQLAFAVSCNSVFAPLGVRVGAARLVATAEDFGFNHSPGVPGAAESTLPSASQIQGELDVGSTAIGQGQVSASALEMATVAATIADGGVRPQPTFALGGGSGTSAGTSTASAGSAGTDTADTNTAGTGSAGTSTASAGSAGTGAEGTHVHAITPAVARTMRRLMIAVVREGTGTAAAIPGVTVAGKTGTAELGGPEACKGASESSSAAGAGGGEAGPSGCALSENPQNTDAWFAAFAPALHPRIAVGVLMVRDGAGGATAAPVARQVLEAGLKD